MMKHIFSLMLFACVFVSLVSCRDTFTIDTPYDAIDKCTIVGRVLDCHGEPYKDVPVKICYEYVEFFGYGAHHDYKLKDSARTDEDGVYRLTLLRKEDERTPEIESDYNRYIVYIDVDMPHYGLVTNWHIDKIDEFWLTKDSVMEDFYLLDSHYIDVSMYGMHPHATRCKIERISKIPFTYDDKFVYFIDSVPFTTRWNVPACSDLRVVRSWNNGNVDTLYYEAFKLPDTIDLSYH